MKNFVSPLPYHVFVRNYSSIPKFCKGPPLSFFEAKILKGGMAPGPPISTCLLGDKLTKKNWGPYVVS